MTTETLPAVTNTQLSIYEIDPIPMELVKRQINAIQQAMKDVMIQDVHYGKIPGTDKETLLKPGAEKLCVMFRLYPHYDEEVIERAAGHREVRTKCFLRTPNGETVAVGIGVCSTMESKYRYRGNEGVSTGKTVPKAYWDSNRDSATIGGKGFVAQKIDGQWMICEKGEKKENPDLADSYNTVAKMSAKRALVHATIGATGCSDIFNQDLEDMNPEDISRRPAPQQRAATPGPVVSVQEKKPEEAPKWEVVAKGKIVEWETFKYRYHLPVKKAGKDMDQVRTWLKEKGFMFNTEDKHWYGDVLVDKISEYLRPILKDGEMPALSLKDPVVPMGTDPHAASYAQYELENDELPGGYSGEF